MRKVPDRTLRDKFEAWYTARWQERYPLSTVLPRCFSLESTRPLRYRDPKLEETYQAFRYAFYLGMATGGQ